MDKDNDEIGRIIVGQIMNDIMGGSGGGGKKGGSLPNEPQSKQAERLAKAFETLNERENFKPGDFIVAKEGHSLWKTSHEGRVLIVVENLEPKYGWELQPHDENSGLGSPYASLRYDIIAAFMDNDGNFTQHVYDSCRFKRYVPQNKIINIFGKKGEL